MQGNLMMIALLMTASFSETTKNPCIDDIVAANMSVCEYIPFARDSCVRFAESICYHPHHVVFPDSSEYLDIR